MSEEPTAGAGSPGGYEVVDHTADWSLRIYGPDQAQLLVNAARGMTALMVGEGETIPLDVRRSLALDAFDAETLLVDWLSELAYWAESEMLVFASFDLSDVTDTHLSAVLTGGRVDELVKHIKAVTYHELQIEHTAEGLTATVVFDV